MKFIDLVYSGHLNTEAKVKPYLLGGIYKNTTNFINGSSTRKKTNFMESIAQNVGSSIEEINFGSLVVDDEKFEGLIQLIKDDSLMNIVNNLDDEKKEIVKMKLGGASDKQIMEDLCIIRQTLWRKTNEAKDQMRKMIESEIF